MYVRYECTRCMCVVYVGYVCMAWNSMLRYVIYVRYVMSVRYVCMICMCASYVRYVRALCMCDMRVRVICVY